MAKTKSKIDWLKVVSAVGFTQAIGLAGVIFTANAIPDWYQALTKPTFTPPDWLFGPVWFSLYILIGLVFYYLWSQPKSVKTDETIRLFFIHLFTNAIWSPVFFGLKQISLAFAVILAMIVTLILLLRRLRQMNRWVWVMLLPYLAWVSFAGALNFAFLLLNGSA